MPSLSSALQKLHIRRRSDAASSPPASPSKTAESNSRRSVDQHKVSESPSGLNDHATSPVPASKTRTSIDSNVQGSPIPGARRSSVDATKDLPPVPTAGGMKRRGSIPRSPGKFALPTIPNTPLAESIERERELTAGKARGFGDKEEILRTPDEREGYRGIGEKVDVDKGIPAPKGHAATHLPPTASLSVTNQNGTKSALVWSDGSRDQVIQKEHDLTPPQQLFPVAIPTAEEVIDGNYSIIPTTQTERQVTKANRDGTTVAKKPWNPAYVATRVLSDHPYPPAATEAECAAHLQRHLALLPATIFSPGSAHRAAHAKPGKARIFQAGPVVSAAARDVELDRQREDLIARLIKMEDEAIAANERFEKAALLDSIRAEKLEAFEAVGWKDRLEIMDTVDITTTVLEPIIQEHVIPIEVTYYTYIINREIHKYHIFPYVQPIADPEPRILPTRHLFKDRDGQWREVWSDEAAEAILGHKLVLDGSDGSKRYTERWIEGVDGVEYELLERESVKVGHKAWVERFGDRPRSVVTSYGGAAGSAGTTTTTTGQITLDKTTTARLSKGPRGNHASPLRNEVVDEERQGDSTVGRAI